MRTQQQQQEEETRRTDGYRVRTVVSLAALASWGSDAMTGLADPVEYPAKSAGAGSCVTGASNSCGYASEGVIWRSMLIALFNFAEDGTVHGSTVVRRGASLATVTSHSKHTHTHTTLVWVHTKPRCTRDTVKTA